jgi:hypothetical protein
VFYEGKREWTAELNFLYKTRGYDIFERYIPKFEYELINLSGYDKESIKGFKDVLSVFLLLSKAEGHADFYKLKVELQEILSKIEIPEDIRELLVQIISGYFKKAEIPEGARDEAIGTVLSREGAKMLENIAMIFEKQY